MPKYLYKAKNLKGKEKEGEIEAQDKKALAAILKSEGFFLLDTKTDAMLGQKKSFGSYLKALQDLFGVSLAEKLFFTRNLGIMLKTGVSLVRAFEMLSSQAKNKKFQTVLLDVSKKVNKGESLSGALGGFPKIFPVLYQETVKVGEETGKLENSLETLALQMEKEHRLKAAITSAMVYPLIVLVMAFCIGIFMMIFAVPQMKKAFSEMDVVLPITTKIIFGCGDFLSKYWFLAVILFALIFAIVFYSVKKGKGSKVASYVFLKIPIISQIVRKTNSALTMRTLSSLFSSGVPIVKSLQVGAGALGNFYFKQSLLEAAKKVERGEKLSSALKPYENLYSPMVMQMIGVGEETGSTSSVLLKLAEFFEEEVASATERLSAIIEPILILFIGAVVGFFAVSMMQPMFSMMENMDK